MSGYFTKEHGSIKLDAGSLTFTFSNEVGDTSVGTIEEGNRPAVAVYARNAIVGVEYGQQNQNQGSFTLNVPRETWTHATSNRQFDAVLHSGNLAGGTNQSPSGPNSPFCWKMTLTHSVGGVSGGLILSAVRLVITSYQESGDVVTAQISFTNYGTVTSF